MKENRKGTNGKDIKRKRKKKQKRNTEKLLSNEWGKSANGKR